MKLERGQRSAVRIAATSAALLLTMMVAYASVSSKETRPSDGLASDPVPAWRPRRQLLLLHPNESADNEDCVRPLQQFNSCQYVRENCSDDVNLVNYLSLIACHMAEAKELGYALLGVWLLYLISLLGTTTENFFVPPLTLMSNKLRLSPSIAGITLLALGNGAPDVFTAYYAIQRDNVALMLGTLAGAAAFITTVVLATLIVFFQVNSRTIGKIDFMRDLISFMVVMGIIIGVIFSKKVTLYQAITFPLLYIAYITITILLSFLRKWQAKKKLQKLTYPKDSDASAIQNEIFTSSHQESTPLLSSGNKKDDAESSGVHETDISNSVVFDRDSHPPEDDGNGLAVIHNETNARERVQLFGLTRPPGRCFSRDCSYAQVMNLLLNFQWLIEFPFSVLRWMTVPPCCPDGKWSGWHKLFAVIYPVPAALLLAISIYQWDSFRSSILADSDFPYALIFFVILGLFVSVLLFFVISSGSPPRWPVQIILTLSAFTTAICWLSILADEIVNVLEALGLIFNIEPAILGITVLAVGNSVADWVADVAVSKAGEPGMAVAACFGAPMFAHTIGLSVALLLKIGIENDGNPLEIDISDEVFDSVKLSWIFLGIILALSAVVFPLFRFSPPRAYGIVLVYIYAVFLIFSVLSEVNVMPIHL